jgi:hypothetical protein
MKRRPHKPPNRHPHRKVNPAWIKRLTLNVIYLKKPGDPIVSTAKLVWTLPAEDVNDASSIDVLDAGVVIGSTSADATSFDTGDLSPGTHDFTVIVRSKAGSQFDSDASNTASVSVPEASVKLTAVSDLSATLA